MVTKDPKNQTLVFEMIWVQYFKKSNAIPTTEAKINIVYNFSDKGTINYTDNPVL